MLINAKVENKVFEIVKNSDGSTPCIVCHNEGYTLKIALDSEWNRFNAKTARFIWAADGKVNKIDTPFTGNEVEIPEVFRTKELIVGVFAEGIRTSTPGVISCKTSILCEDGEVPDPAPDVYNEIIRLINEMGASGGSLPMGGATAGEDGYPGLVPKPVAGSQDKVLHGDGTWRYPASGSNADVQSLKDMLYGFDNKLGSVKEYVDASAGSGGGGSVAPPDLVNRIEVLEQQVGNLTYEAIAITSFTHNVGVKEYGETVSSATLSWDINKTPTTLTLGGEVLSVHERSKVLTGLSITKDNNPVWKLLAMDERGATSEKTASIAFYNGVYYGAKEAPASYDSAFILGLTKELRSNKKPSFAVRAGAGQYIYYCYPVRMGGCAFNVGGFEGGFELVGTVTFTNASGYAEDYFILKSINANLGYTTVTVL